jgi:dihydropteroate synthase
MGVLNVTPDSFSDGGRFFDPGAATAHGERLAAEGADIIDVGGESSRPGSEPVGAEEELRRVIPVIEALAGRVGVPISIDTVRAVVADRAAAAGAALVNDVSALRFDPEVADVVRARGLGLVLMHSRKRPGDMQEDVSYGDVTAEVAAELGEALGRAAARGVSDAAVAIDPGIGFAKRVEDNLRLLRDLPDLASLGRPIVVGPSRKSFIGAVTGAAVDDRVPGTLAAAAIAVFRGAHVVRVHDVAPARQAVDLAAAIREGGGSRRA